MDKMLSALSAGLPGLGLTLSEDIQKQLCDFGRAMVKQNEVMNLTGITEDEAVAKMHLLDSLTVLSTADLGGKSLIDVGCGAVLAMKGSAAKEELAECGNAIKKLGLKVEEVREFPIDGTNHAVIVLQPA